MVSSLKQLPYEERLSRLKLPTLERKKKERGDLIAVYRASKGLEKIDRDDLFVWDDRTRGHENKVTNWKDYMQDRHKKYSFPYRSIETWNKLNAEVINARSIHDFKNKLDNSRFGDGIVRA